MWELTVNVVAWSEFMPTMQWLRPLQDGPLRPGSRVRIKQPAQLPLVWTVTDLEPPSLFAWEAKLAIWKLRATHRIEPDGLACTNHLQFELSGPFSQLIGIFLSPVINWVLKTENGCFLKRADLLLFPDRVMSTGLRPIDDPLEVKEMVPEQ